MRLARRTDYNILMDPWLGISFPSAFAIPCPCVVVVCLSAVQSSVAGRVLSYFVFSPSLPPPGRVSRGNARAPT